MTSSQQWGVVAALPEEVKPLHRRLQNSRRVRLAPGQVVAGRLGDNRVVVMATGDGANLAENGLEQLLSAFELHAVIVIGIAGGLSDDLEVGSVVAAKRVTNESGEAPEPDSELLATSNTLPGVRLGEVHSHAEIAIDPIAKARLWQQIGGDEASVVDLESASYAAVAAAHRVPYLVLRAVSDSYDEALPLDFNRFRKPDGGSDRGRVLRYSLRHPSIVPELIQLRERLRHCAGRLAELVEEVLTR